MVLTLWFSGKFWPSSSDSLVLWFTGSCFGFSFGRENAFFYLNSKVFRSRVPFMGKVIGLEGRGGYAIMIFFPSSQLIELLS